MFFRKNKIELSIEEKRERRNDRLLLILSGILLGVSYPPFPFPFPLFLFFGFIPFLYVISKRNSLLRINQAAYLTNIVLSIISIYWVGSWQTSADPFLMMAGGVLIFFYPVVLLIPSTLYYLSQKIFKKEISIYLFPLFWVTSEYLLTLTDLRFPWLTLGHGLAKFISFIQIAEIIGAFGLSIIVLYINVLLYKALISSRKSINRSIVFASIATVIFVFVTIYGFLKISNKSETEKSVRVGIIQPNIDPWNKWETGNLDQMLSIYLGMSQECADEGAKIIFWPETALPVYLYSGEYSSDTNRIQKFLDSNSVSLLTGMPDIRYHYENIPKDAKQFSSSNLSYTTYNSILMISPGSEDIQRYGKMKLVPLGERTPFVDQIPFLGDFLKWGVGLSGWNVGKDTTVFNVKIDSDTVRIGGIVCYESVFPVFVTHFADRGAQFIAVVTNDSWYGNSSGPYQHKEFAALRAVENRKAVIRCANGGISSLTDKFGVTKAETKMFTKTTLTVDVPLSSEKTFYTENPSIVPVLSAVFSLWIFGINILLWLKRKFKM